MDKKDLRPRTTGDISLQSDEVESISDSMFSDALHIAEENLGEIAIKAEQVNRSNTEERANVQPPVPPKVDNKTVRADQVNRSNREEPANVQPPVAPKISNESFRAEQVNRSNREERANVQPPVLPKVSHETDLSVSPQMIMNNAQPTIAPVSFEPTSPSTMHSLPHVGPTVFFTYLKDEPQAWGDVRNMYAQLRKGGIRTRMEENEKQLLAMSINGWLNDNVEGSNFIIVCIDTLYKNRIARGNYNKNDQLHVRAHYIFNQLQTEYMHNQCLNFRVLPVLVGGATLADVPLFLQNTTVYQWPQRKNELMDRIFRRQEYSAPELGDEPVAIFDTCTD